jgi:hypothetical protein
MSTYYVSNENGDWWTINTIGNHSVGQTLFIIEAGELAKLTDTTDLDGLERHIREHGTAQDIEVI